MRRAHLSFVNPTRPEKVSLLPPQEITVPMAKTQASDNPVSVPVGKLAPSGLVGMKLGPAVEVNSALCREITQILGASNPSSGNLTCRYTCKCVKWPMFKFIHCGFICVGLEKNPNKPVTLGLKK